MALFEKKETAILGVDIGTSSIKVIEVDRGKEGHRLITYGFVEDFHRDLRNLGKEDANLTSQAIRSVVQRARCRSRRAIAALPTYAVFTSLISLPQLSGDELDSAIHWEAKKIIPLPLDDIVLDYRILNANQKKSDGGFRIPFGKKNSGAPEEEEQLKILITGAAKETVEKYTEIFSLSGLELVGLETEMFALSRSIIGTQPGEIMIVEIGSAVTDIIIMEHGIPFFGRSLEQGGAGITRAIMNSLHINDKRAEQLKRDIGIRAGGQDASGVGGVPQIITSALEPIIHEIRYTLDLYKSHGATPSGRASGIIEKIVLTGGTALLPGIAEHLAQALDTRMFVGDPWSFLRYPIDLKSVLAGIGPKFSVAIGLALRE